MKIFAMATAAVALLVGTAYAQMPQETGGANPSGIPAKIQGHRGVLSQADHSFATKAAGAGQAEVNEAKLAVKKASSADVQQFAQRMISDHTKANNQLKQIARSEGVKLPSRSGPADRAEANRLSHLSGRVFDSAYVSNQVKAHQDAVALFSQENQMGSDARLKAFAAQTLPTLQEHLNMINQIAANAANQR